MNFSKKQKYLWFYYKIHRDHLGNIREVLDANGAVCQYTDYYAFGAPFCMPGTYMGASLQPYKYNGKELDLMHGLNTYNHGARQNYSILGRWDRIDPRCEDYYDLSPYVYCGDNPILCVDPDGKAIETAWDVANVLYDVGAAIYNHVKGDHETAKSHWVDAGADVAATFVPFVPAGTTKLVGCPVCRTKNALD